MRVAAIGIGSNSLRMVIAQTDSRGIVKEKRYREGLRLFAALDEHKNIGSDMIARSCEKIAEYCDIAEQEGAESIHIFATSAVRDAANRAYFAECVKEKCGHEVDICDGEKEAALSYWGACESGDCSLIDIGGGSTEVICGHGVRVDTAKSFQVGAVRLYRDMPVFSMEDALLAEKKVMDIFSEGAVFPKANCKWIGVGGTFTTSVFMKNHLPCAERYCIPGSTLMKEDILNSIKELVPLSVEERKKLPWIQPQRADIIVHGLIILLACFEHWNIPVISVSENGNLEGYLRHTYHLIDCVG